MSPSTDNTQLVSNSQTLQPLDHLIPVTDLTKIFPDIEDQLCSRHSTLFGKLKNTFNKLYDNMEPSYYVIVKGNTHIIGTQQDQVELSMGLQNGIILLVTKTYENANIFINGNHMDQQVILNCKGKVQQGLYQLSQEFQGICRAALMDSAGDKLYGGIIYIHANIPEGFYNYRNSLFTALYLSMMLINNKLQNYSISQLINQLSETKLVDHLFLQKQFYDYENRQFLLMVGNTMYKVPLDKNIKLLFCKLDLASCDVRHSQTNIQEIKEDKDKILKWIRDHYGVNSFYEAFQNELQISLDKMSTEEDSDNEKMQYMKLVEAQLRELRILCEYSNNNLSIQDLIMMKWIIDSKMRGIFSQEVVQLVENIKEKTKIQACTIVEGQYIMLAVDRRKYAELICTLRQLLHKGELKSKSCFKLEEQLVEHRWSDDSEIGEKIFVSVPSKGIGIFDPSQAIWFD